jgi:hypothetical protein
MINIASDIRRVGTGSGEFNHNWSFYLDKNQIIVQGIAPTIIVVRVGLGNSVDGVDSFLPAGDSGPVMDIRVYEDLDYWGGKKDPDIV